MDTVGHLMVENGDLICARHGISQQQQQEETDITETETEEDEDSVKHHQHETTCPKYNTSNRQLNGVVVNANGSAGGASAPHQHENELIYIELERNEQL